MTLEPAVDRPRGRRGRRPLALAAGVAAAGSLLIAAGCGHGTAAASDHDEPDEPRLSELLRVLGHDREAEAADPPAARGSGRLAMTIERSPKFGTSQAVPPADREDASRLTPEEVLLSFAMYGEAGRHDQQWPLLSEATRRAWRERIRREARRIGLPEVEDRVAATEARSLWARGFAAGGDVPIDLAVRWRTTIDGDRATVRILRDGEAIDDVPLVRERGGWRLELADRLQPEPAEPAEAAGAAGTPGTPGTPRAPAAD